MVTRETVSMSLELESAIIRTPLVVSPKTFVLNAIRRMAKVPLVDRTEATNLAPSQQINLTDVRLTECGSCVVAVEADGRVCGLLTERDVVHLSAQQRPLDTLRIGEVMTSPVVTLDEADFTHWDVAYDLLRRHHIRHLPLLDAQNRLSGLVTQGTLQSLFERSQDASIAQFQASQQPVADSLQGGNAQRNRNHYVVRSRLLRSITPDFTQSDLKQQAVLAAIPDYLFCVDAQGIYRQVVTYKQGITLFAENLDPVGLSMMAVLPVEIAHQQMLYLQEALSSGDLKTYEHQVQCDDQWRDEEVRVVKIGEDEVLFMVRDISDRKQAERQLQNLIEGTAATTGQNFFPALVRHIAVALEVNYVMVTELIDGKLHTLAFWANGSLHDPISYYPEETPCEHTLNAGRFHHETLVQQAFPKDVDLVKMNANSYSGIALCDTQGNTMGHLCVLDQQPLKKPERAEDILQVFAARATAELERQRAIESLEQLNQNLEARVSERTVALREREQFLQAVLDTFPISVFWKDLNSAYLGCNRNFLKDAGLDDIAEMIGKTDYDMPWGADHAVHAQRDDREVMQSNAAKLGIEETLIKADGQQIWIETNKMPLRSLTGKVVGVLGTYQDITVRKQLELDLQSSKKQLSEVLDSAIASIIRLRLYADMSMQYDYISPHFTNNVGYTVQDILSVPDLWKNSVDPDDWDAIIRPVIGSILNDRGASIYQMEYRLRCQDGSIAWILSNCFAQWNEARGYWEVTIVETDISDRKKAEAQLQNLILGTAAVGQDFFPALTRHIAEALDVSYVVVSECIDNNLHSLAIWAKGELQPNAIFQLVDTPCERTMEEGLFYCEGSIQQCFPDYLLLYEMAAESYLGIALRDTQEDVIGILCIVHQQPLSDPQRAIQVLQIFAARAAAELERQKANIALEQLNHALEAKVVERTAELQEREQFLQTVLDTFPLSIFWKDLNSVYRGGNRNFLMDVGLASLAEIQGKTDYDLPWTPLETEICRTEDRQVITSNTPKLGIIARTRKANGEQIWTETNKLPLHNLEGQIIGVLGTFQDITEHKEAEAIIKQQLAAMEAVVDGIGILQNGIYIYVNQAHLSLFGYTHSEELLGESWQMLYSPAQIQRFEQEIMPDLEHARAWQGESIASRKDGSTFAEGLSLTLTDEGLLICVCRDISELKQAQDQIVHNALHDPLTGLPNRSFLVDRLELAIDRSQRLKDYRYAVLFLDLDRFKVINDSLGHYVGDQLLIEVSKRLRLHLRHTDMVARLGGDEFVILLEDVNGTEDIIHCVEQILADGQTPITIDEHQVFINTSIGIATGHNGYSQASTIIRDADIAMYCAKAQENTFYKFFDEVMHAEVMSRMTLETDLRHAFNQQELVLTYQPIVSLADRQLIGFEPLIRWQHPHRGTISPESFIPIAEETGLITTLDSWVIFNACEQLASWQQQFPGHTPLRLSINLSVQDLYRSSLLQDIDHILNSTPITGDLITFEITESILIEDIDQTIDFLTKLATRQIKISIDDFGTGYSSLSYLQRLPVHSLKIDRSFVSNMQVDNRDYQLVGTILALAKQLGLMTVAEGIETQHHLYQLQQLGCQFGQGYLFSKPLTVSDVEVMLANSNPMLKL
ncbi:MAG: EAL domain-containing protein [Leptolyngbyaceae cyanobacterium MAG.088]|nr:EAL domain-containing protein [Leptolyngbyaceae cyanobacterium MAG.088]